MRASWHGLCPPKQGFRVFPIKSQFSICFKGGAAIETFQPAIINLDHQSIEFDDHTHAAYTKFVKSELDLWTRVINTAGIKAQ